MPLEVIGAGYGRTGTMSLKLALEQLGLGPCFHMSEAIANPACIPGWVAAARGRPDWEKLFAGFRSSVDHPGCAFYRELAAAYPHAKVVLTVRDANDWFDSTQATVFSPTMRTRVADPLFKEFLTRTVWGLFGAGIDDRELMVEAFARHSAEVQSTIAPERLLVFEVSQGWAPLCNFLGVPVPATPFPRVNSRAEMAAMLAMAGNVDGGVEGGQMATHGRELLERLKRR
jgi:Sulfotransferase domain